MKKIIMFSVFITVSILFVIVFVNNLYSVAAQQATVCCEKTNSGAFCQDVPEDECADGFRKVPTACESTSYCKPGVCFDSTEGICLDNTPQLVCDQNGGVWNEESPLQCSLGCCILGDQAAYVSLVRCKLLSSQLGLETNYDSSIQSELACIVVVQAQDRGACVFEVEFENRCEFTTRAECDTKNVITSEGTDNAEFFKDKLCSAEELGTICGPSQKTTCVPGNDEVYFIDTCGNPANIYDASKAEDQEYWTNVKSKLESCNPDGNNALSKGCGNCNYLSGSFCRSEKIAGGNPTLGDFMCADLNCKDTSNGGDYFHGESWCVNSDAGTTGEGANSVGSRFFRHICVNGEEIVESCSDFRAEECIQDESDGFRFAACRVNRWQDCTAQADEDDCENSDQRECIWKEGAQFGNRTNGGCVPKNPPGLNFWSSPETKQICAQAHATCVVTFEKKLVGGTSCKKNCHCLTDEWAQGQAELCSAMGDCGPGINWVGVEGADDTTIVTITKVKESE